MNWTELVAPSPVRRPVYPCLPPAVVEARVTHCTVEWLNDMVAVQFTQQHCALALHSLAWLAECSASRYAERVPDACAERPSTAIPVVSLAASNQDTAVDALVGRMLMRPAPEDADLHQELVIAGLRFLAGLGSEGAPHWIPSILETPDERFLEAVTRWFFARANHDTSASAEDSTVATNISAAGTTASASSSDSAAGGADATVVAASNNNDAASAAAASNNNHNNRHQLEQRVYATGVLAVMLQDSHVADALVRGRDAAPVLLQRLLLAVQRLEYQQAATSSESSCSVRSSRRASKRPLSPSQQPAKSPPSKRRRTIDQVAQGVAEDEDQEEDNASLPPLLQVERVAMQRDQQHEDDILELGGTLDPSMRLARAARAALLSADQPGALSPAQQQACAASDNARGPADDDEEEDTAAVAAAAPEGSDATPEEVNAREALRQRSDANSAFGRVTGWPVSVRHAMAQPELLLADAEPDVVPRHQASEAELLDMELVFLVRCLSIIGQYQELLGILLQHDVLGLTAKLLRLRADNRVATSETLSMLTGMLAHRKAAVLFVQAHGLDLLTSLPRTAYLSGTLLSCLAGVWTMPPAMELVCQYWPMQRLRSLLAWVLDMVDSPFDASAKMAILLCDVSFEYPLLLQMLHDLDAIRLLVRRLHATLVLADPTASQRVIVAGLNSALVSYLRVRLARMAVPLLRRLYRDGAVAPCVTGTFPSRTAKFLPSMSFPSHPVDFRPLQVDYALVVECCDMLAAHPGFSGDGWSFQHWEPAAELIAAGAVPVALRSMRVASSWRMPDIQQNTLELLRILCVTRAGRVAVADAAIDDIKAVGVIIGAASQRSVVMQAPETIKGALALLSTIIHSPPLSRAAAVAAAAASMASRRTSIALQQLHVTLPAPGRSADSAPSAAIERFRRVVFDDVRAHSGIKWLLWLLRAPVIPSTHADEIRAAACTTLASLTVDRTIAQILTNLRVSSWLGELMREPVLPERSREHSVFRSAAMRVISATAGADSAALVPHDTQAENVLDKIERANVVAHTRISYHHSELLDLIQAHLRTSGLHRAAAALVEERVALQQRQQHGAQTPAGALADALPVRRVNAAKPLVVRPSRRPAASCSISLPTPRQASDHSSTTVTQRRFSRLSMPPTPSFASPAVSPRRRLRLASSVSNVSSATPVHASSTAMSAATPAPVSAATTPAPVSAATTPAPVSAATTPAPVSVAAATPASSSAAAPASDTTSLQDSSESTAAAAAAAATLPSHSNTNVTLDAIVKEYLRNQHRRCARPISLIPPMSLRRRHRCPQPSAPTISNVATRVLRRQAEPPCGGRLGRELDRHFVYSRLRSVASSRTMGAGFRCVAFLDDNLLATGTSHGNVDLLASDLEPVQQVGVFPMGSTNAPISVHPQDRRCFITTSTSHELLVWRMANMSLGDPILTTEGFEVATWHPSGERILATAGPTASILDASRGDVITTLADSAAAGTYRNNRAVYSPGGNLVLHEGTLWDVRVPSKVHRFDRISNWGAGSFNPRSMDILINSEVWDFRTFKLLTTCPALDQCVVQWSTSDDVLFATASYENMVMPATQVQVKRRQVLRTLDGATYTSIATMDMERVLWDLAVSPFDMQVATVEQETNSNDACVRIYDIGRKRPGEVDSDNEGDDDDDDDDADDADDDDDDDDDDEEVDHVEDHDDNDIDLDVDDMEDDEDVDVVDVDANGDVIDSGDIDGVGDHEDEVDDDGDQVYDIRQLPYNDIRVLEYDDDIVGIDFVADHDDSDAG